MKVMVGELREYLGKRVAVYATLALNPDKDICVRLDKKDLVRSLDNIPGDTPTNACITPDGVYMGTQGREAQD